MHENPDRIWAPPESRVQIEYSTAVISQLSVESAKGDSGGFLLGTRHGDIVRIVQAQTCRPSDNYDPIRSASEGLAPAAVPRGVGLVGIFSVRTRGEIFLTDSDLHRFEQTELDLEFSDGSEAEPTGAVDPRSPAGTIDLPPENVALVVAGGKGGFFVRDHDGSIQAVRSYQEFRLAGRAANPALASVPLGRLRVRWSWVLLTAVAAAMPVFLPPLLSATLRAPSQRAFRPEPLDAGRVESRHPGSWTATASDRFAAGLQGLHLASLLREAPMELTLLGGAEALCIAWNPLATTEGAQLEISDGARRIAIPVSGNLSSVTYEPEGGDVEVRLTVQAWIETLPGNPAAARSERVRFVSDRGRAEAIAPPAIDLASEQVLDQPQEATNLRDAIEVRRTGPSTSQRLAFFRKRLRQFTRPGGK